MEHRAEARVDLMSARLFAPTLQQLRQELDLRGPSGLLARPIARGLRALGLELVRRDGVEELEYLMRHGIISGGAAFSDYLETELVDHVFRNAAIFAAPANVYVALFTSATTDAGGGTEVSGGSYAREAVGTTSGWTGSGGATDNAADVDFGTATANWGTVTHTAVMDAATAGNMLFHGALTASKTVNNGDSFKFAIGALDVSLD